jgi:hypothetical protein
MDKPHHLACQAIHILHFLKTKDLHGRDKTAMTT